ncbi:zinc-binding dehydrogenase [Ottowia sp.]|uniref:zinc-binding dehydrogenase n=1 Tax=Ottowia sp. TaxID=1898956 RepID=UPI0025DB2723|nr:zinc-binding dehydrogenase [Ottowia sp.]MBK6614022.1 zinc-binding dehydrogenase [Ottowia sp.]MBK6745419.1 zinc-binding dehydrogenase [Ottowia sp.]
MPLQLRSLVREDALLELSLADVPPPRVAAPDEVLVRVEAAPMNPSDLGLLFGGADMRQAKGSGTADRPVVTAPVPDAAMAAGAARVGRSMPVGNEGAGTVVAAGASPAAQALLGRKVAALGGAMFAEYCVVPAQQCLALPDGASAAEGASCFVNPMTALGMVETVRAAGHQALVHSVGASNLGQMLLRICQKDGIGLVNIVRKPEQAELLRGLGARHVVDSSQPDFTARLTDAIAATGARMAFDATGGGRMAGRLLAAMEAALLRRPGQAYDRYGSQVHKQVYIYGYLERGPIELPPGLGMAWNVGGWLLFPFLKQLAPERLAQLKQRVADELTTTFASRYAREITLAQALTPEAIGEYARMSTGRKTLLRLAAR